jgi:hypothetical protein
MESPPLLAGFAEVDFTPEPGLTLLGQMHERRGERTRDPLLATAMAVRSGEELVVLVSVDICVLPIRFVTGTQALFQQRTGLPASRLLLHATQTHLAPTVTSFGAAVAEPAFIEHLRSAIVTAAERAIGRLEPMELFAGTGHMEHMGWNRRAMFSDGRSRMYGHAGQPGFIGMEGPRDPALPVLFARGANGEILGVVMSFSTHPNAIENERVYSADIPGATRQVLKRLLGSEVAVVYLTAAVGNTAPSMLDPHVPEQPWRGEGGLQRSGLYMGGEAARVIASCTAPMASPILRLEQTTLSIPIRPWPSADEPTYPEPLFNESWKQARAYYQQNAADWRRRLAEESPIPVRLSVLRLGDAAICTNPAELFVEYGLAIRERSPARVTLIGDLTDGYVGYVPTRLAFRRGGYETWPASGSHLVPEAGGQIVGSALDLLEAAFADRNA